MELTTIQSAAVDEIIEIKPDPRFREYVEDLFRQIARKYNVSFYTVVHFYGIELAAQLYHYANAGNFHLFKCGRAFSNKETFEEHDHRMPLTGYDHPPVREHKSRVHNKSTQSK